MTLEEARVKQEYEIKQIHVGGGLQRRLEALGMISGTMIEVLNRKKNGTLIYKMRGTRYAVGKGIATKIEIQEVKD